MGNKPASAAGAEALLRAVSDDGGTTQFGESRDAHAHARHRVSTHVRAEDIRHYADLSRRFPGFRLGRERQADGRRDAALPRRAERAARESRA